MLCWGGVPCNNGLLFWGFFGGFGPCLADKLPDQAVIAVALTVIKGFIFLLSQL